MTDREKVIAGLKSCLKSEAPCQACPYYEDDCTDGLMGDTLELLEDQKPKLLEDCYRPYLGLDKDNLRVWRCRNCDLVLAYAGCDDRPWEGRNFCSMCGKPLKWEKK